MDESKKPFLTNEFKYAVNSYSDFILALAVVDLPFSADNHKYEPNHRGLDIIASSPIIAFYKEIVEDECVELDEDVLIL